MGKTYLARLLAQEIFLQSDSLVRIDMSEFNEKHTVSRLLGSPPGYVGYGEFNNFTDRIRKNPYSLVLFDEIEKAHPEVFHILLQVLEDGFLTDGMGRKINFKKTILVFTSNLGNDEHLKELMGFSASSSKNILHRQKKIIRQKIEDFLKPEFLNRLTDIIYFNPLDKKALTQIADIEIKKLENRLRQEKKINVKMDSSAAKKIAQECVENGEGARGIRKYIQQNIEEPIAQRIIEGRSRDKLRIAIKN